MGGRVFLGGHTFERDTDIIEVTNNHRPDVSWVFADAANHIHRWFDGDEPAKEYRPDRVYKIPSLKWVKDGEAYWPGDDEPHDIGHRECVECGEHVEPGYTADRYKQYIQGLTHLTIDGVSVSPEEFQRRYEEEIAKRGKS